MHERVGDELSHSNRWWIKQRIDVPGNVLHGRFRLFRATHSTASSSIAGIGPVNVAESTARTAEALSGGAAARTAQCGRCCCGYSPSASRPATVSASP